MKLKDSHFKKIIPLLVILLVTAIVRIYGAVHNIIPTASELNFMNAVERMTNTVSLDTQYINHPDNVILFVGFAIINLYSLLRYGKLCTGTIAQVIGGDTTPEWFTAHMNQYLTVGRIMNVGFSLLAIYFIYKIAEEVKEGSGVFSAILAAAFPSYNVWSGCLLSDTAVTTLVGGGIYFSVLYLKNHRKNYLVIATVLCALATAQKYTALLSCLLIVACVVMDNWAGVKNIKRFFLSSLKSGIRLIGVFVVAFIVFAPNVITNFGRTVQIFLSESRPHHPGADGLGFIGNMSFYAGVFWTQMGVFICLLAFLGCVYIVKKKMTFAVPVYWGIAFGIIISVMKLHWERWGLAIYITPIVLAGIGLQSIRELFPEKWSGTVYKGACIAAAVVMVCVGTDVWLDTIVKGLPDTRYLSADALHQMNENITTDNSYVEPWTPLAPTGDSSLFMDADRKENAPYVMVASYNYDAKFSSERFSPETYSTECNWYRNLFDTADCIYEIKPWLSYKLFRDVTEYGDMEYTVPIVKVFDNIQNIVSYYRQPVGKYYGPTIRIYKR